MIYFRKPRRALLHGSRSVLLRRSSSAASAVASPLLSATKRAPTGLGTPKVALAHGDIRGRRRRRSASSTRQTSSSPAKPRRVPRMKRLVEQATRGFAGKLQVVRSTRSTRLMAIARYTFLPWLRRGIANAIAAAGLGRAARRVDGRARRRKRRRATGALRSARSSQLIGPGDVIGINPQIVVRTEPRALGHRLRAELPRVRRVLRRGLPLALHAGARRRGRAPADPWITLLVLAEGDEFERDARPAGR